MELKRAQTVVAIHDIIARRFSPRAFDPNKPVSKVQQLALMEAARWAPSCFGEEPWRYIFCDRFQEPTAWEKLLSVLTEKNQSWAKNAPLLILSCTVGHFSHNNNSNRWAQYDTGAASENLCLQAVALGLCVHQMGGFDADKVRQLLAIPSEATPMAVMAVGELGDIRLLSAEHQLQEQSVRKRAEMGSHFFRGKWGGV